VLTLTTHLSKNCNIQQNLLDLFRSLTLSSDIERAISEKVLEKSGGKKGGKAASGGVYSSCRKDFFLTL
jgi:hypothetical protein